MSPTHRSSCAVLSALGLLLAGPVLAGPADPWWDEAWPYRAIVEIDGPGVAEAVVDFTAAFATLGRPGALLDLHSLRVVPVGAAEPIPHAETLSVVLEDADAPQIGWRATGVYWIVNDGSLAADSTRFAEGTGSLHATIENLEGGYGYPGVELRLANDHPLADWRPYETLLYRAWPEVNASALDQAPDLVSFKLYDTAGCPTSSVTQGGPPLALDRWNTVVVSLDPLHTCTTPDLADISRLELHTRDNETVNGNSGLWDDGDVLDLWLDDWRLVDQDGGGSVLFESSGAGRYAVYFDVLEHQGHPEPTLATLGTPTRTATLESPEAGGYLHLVAGATRGSGLEVWSAPAVEKLPPTHATPVATSTVRLEAAKGEREARQFVVRSGSSTSLPVSWTALTGPSTIPASAVTVHRVDTVPIADPSDHFGRVGDWPDPLMPLASGATVSFPSGRAQALWLTVAVPRSADPGVYTGALQVGAVTVPWELEVWDFELPTTLHLASEWGFGWSSIVETWKGTIGGSVQPCYWDLVDDLYEDFAAHRLTPKGVGWPAGLNYPGGVAYDCDGGLDPYSWGIWGFDSLADRYLAGSDLENADGFPSFLIRGPASNWPPNSRPSSFCDESRGTDPPGNAGYNTKWFQYWGAVEDYLLATADSAEKGYVHLVNEPQTFDDYDIVAYLAEQMKLHAPGVRLLLSEQVEPAIHDHPTYPGAEIDIWMPTISNYQVERAHARQRDHGEQVWWYFLYGDRPPLPNPTVIDRPGIEARAIPWLAWRERVDGLLYYATTLWNGDPWTDPWLENGNGDGFLFYPPPDATIAFDACDPQSNRLVPSIRWELLHEGMEDYEYLWLLEDGRPGVDETGAADAWVDRWVASRTLFSRVPTDLATVRRELALALVSGEIFADGFESGDTAAW